METLIKTEYGFSTLSINDVIEIDEEGSEIKTGEYCMIDLIQISKKFRKKGHGTALLKLAITEAKSSRLDVILAALPKDNSISMGNLVNFYKKHGFVPSDDQPSSSVIMELWE